MVNYLSNDISVFRINQITGNLTLQATAVAGAQPRYIAIDPAGRFAYVIGNEAIIRCLAIDQANGTLTAQSTAATVNSPDSVTVDPTGRYVYVSGGTGDNVTSYTVNAATGTLTKTQDLVTGMNPFFIGILGSAK